MLFRAMLNSVEDSGDFQIVKISGVTDEERDGAKRFAGYGFASNPPPGTEAIACGLGGSRESLVIIATDHTGRPKNLLAGEVKVYNVITGEEVYFKADGTIRLGKDAADPVIRKSDLVTIFSNGTPTPNDGGAALKTAWTTAANSAGSAKVFAK